MKTLWVLVIVSVIVLTGWANIHAEGLKGSSSAELYKKKIEQSRPAVSSAGITQRRRYILRMIHQSEAQLVIWRERLRKLDDAEAIRVIEGR